MVLTFLNVFSFTMKICVCIVSSILSHFYSVIMYNEKKHLCVFLNCARTQRLLCSFISCFFKILSRIQAITLPIVTECYNMTLMALISTCSLTQTGTLWGHTQSPAISHRSSPIYQKHIDFPSAASLWSKLPSHLREKHIRKTCAYPTPYYFSEWITRSFTLPHQVRLSLTHYFALLSVECRSLLKLNGCLCLKITASLPEHLQNFPLYFQLAHFCNCRGDNGTLKQVLVRQWNAKQVQVISLWVLWLLRCKNTAFLSIFNTLVKTAR